MTRSYIHTKDIQLQPSTRHVRACENSPSAGWVSPETHLRCLHSCALTDTSGLWRHIRDLRRRRRRRMGTLISLSAMLGRRGLDPSEGMNPTFTISNSSSSSCTKVGNIWTDEGHEGSLSLTQSWTWTFLVPDHCANHGSLWSRGRF